MLGVVHTARMTTPSPAAASSAAHSCTLVLLPSSRLSASELHAAALDGEVVPIGEGFVPIDAPITATARAASLLPLLIDDRVVVADRSAAWVWGWSPAPASIATCVAITARIPSPDRRRLRAREVVIDDDELRMLGPVVVTSPVRTLLDLARHDQGDDVVALLAAGIAAHDVAPNAIEAALTRRRSLSFVRSARRRLAAAFELARDGRAAQPLLTR